MISKRVVLHFPNRLIDQPIIYLLSKKYDLTFNILLARIMPNEEGLMVVELSGTNDNYNDGVEYLKTHEVDVQLLSRDARRNNEICIQCGACTIICPTGALSIHNRKTMEVEFDVEKCVACGLCVPACPPRAMQLAFEGLEEFGLAKLA